MPISVPAGAIRHTGRCLQPVLLRGRADYIDGRTGELIHRHNTVHEPGGVLPIACKTRRASRCLVQRLRPGTVASLHHHPAQVTGPPGRAHRPGPRRAGPGLLRQGGRISASWRRPLPRCHPLRRPRRAEHGPARLGHHRPAHQRHRPCRPRRQRQGSRRAGAPGPHARVGPPTRHPPGHRPWRRDQHQGRGLRGQVRHQGRRMHRHSRSPPHPCRPDRRPARP